MGLLRAAIVILLAAASVLGLAAPAAADIYRCEGADGSLHFTNRRQRGANCTLIAREARVTRARPPASSRHADSIRMAGQLARRAGVTPGRGATDPDRYRRYDAYFQEAARLYRLPVAFLRAVTRVESDFYPNVVSRTGAMGLMQLMPRTAASMGVRNPFDPRQNILGGARFLRILANRFGGDLVLTVAAYNAGEGSVRRYRGVPPYASTQRYVRKVVHFFYQQAQRSS